MKNIETAIEAAWQKSRGEEEYDPGYPVKASDNFADGYKAGVAEALCSQWVSVEDELPPDGEEVIAVLVNGNDPFVTVAWCYNVSNGTKRWCSNYDNLDLDLVRYWMPIPPMPEGKEGTDKP